jgi:hypothetical protein
MRATSLTPPSTSLSGTQFSTLNNAGINDPEGPEKYNNTQVKFGAIFYSCHTAQNDCLRMTTDVGVSPFDINSSP